MAFSISTGLANHLATGGSLKSAVDGKVIRVYAGPVPASADAAIDPAAHTLLCTLSKDDGGDGLTMDGEAVGGVIGKSRTEAWLGTNTDSGVAAFFRFTATDDDGAASVTAIRIQGTVGLANADFLVGDTVCATGDQMRCDSCNMGIPV